MPPLLVGRTILYRNAPVVFYCTCSAEKTTSTVMGILILQLEVGEITEPTRAAGEHTNRRYEKFLHHLTVQILSLFENDNLWSHLSFAQSEVSS